MSNESDVASAAQLVEIFGVFDVLNQAIPKLDVSQREVLALVIFDLQELDYETVANILDVPIGTVRSRLFGILQALQNALPRVSGRKSNAEEGLSNNAKYLDPWTDVFGAMSNGIRCPKKNKIVATLKRNCTHN